MKDIRIGRGNDRELCMVSSGHGWMIFILSYGTRYREMGSKRVPDHFLVWTVEDLANALADDTLWP